MDTATRPKTNEPDFSTAYFFLEGLNEIGIDYLFCNFGTDHAPIIEEIAHRRSRGEALPGIIRCPHENTAAHMAARLRVRHRPRPGRAGACRCRHRQYRDRDAQPVPQPHPGAADGRQGAVHGRRRARRATRDTYVHFVQEPFDQGSLVRPYVKWEWTLPSGVVVKEALRRAHSIMQSEPRGPVYLMMQRETLTQSWNADDVRRFSAEQYGSTTGGGADPALIAQLADRLIKAEHPILITGYAGRNARASQLILELAEFAGIAVFEGNATTNISHDSPCFLGFQPGKHLPKADVGLLVDVDVPWFPSDVQANPGHVLGAHRHRHSQAGVADVDLPGQPADAGRGRANPGATSCRAESEGDAGVQASRPRRASSDGAPSTTPTSSVPASSPPTKASPARSACTICSPNSARCSARTTSSSTRRS